MNFVNGCLEKVQEKISSSFEVPDIKQTQMLCAMSRQEADFLGLLLNICFFFLISISKGVSGSFMPFSSVTERDSFLVEGFRLQVFKRNDWIIS